jgi:hypothetical protein
VFGTDAVENSARSSPAVGVRPTCSALVAHPQPHLGEVMPRTNYRCRVRQGARFESKLKGTSRSGARDVMLKQLLRDVDTHRCLRAEAAPGPRSALPVPACLGRRHAPNQPSHARPRCVRGSIREPAHGRSGLRVALRLEDEDLRREIGLDVIPAHEGRDRAIGECFDRGDVVRTHRILVRAARV